MSEELNRAKLNRINFFHMLAQAGDSELLIKTSDYTIVGSLLTEKSILSSKQQTFVETRKRWVSGTELTDPFPISIILTDAVVYGINPANGQGFEIIEVFLDKIDAISLHGYVS
ncbi:hypothetical protein [Abiotrophia defectiva]